MGYRVSVVGGVNQAIQEAMRFAPDVIIANLHLPGLSGKDLLVALSSQGVEVPIVVLSPKGADAEVIQAFRLGASDYLSWPVREAEILSVVERALKQVRARSEREGLARQLNQTNHELQRRVRELTTIFGIGKAVTSITDIRTLFDKILEGAMYVTEGDSSWLLTKDDRAKAFVLSACRNLPETITEKIGQPWDDGISSLVALSGETLSIHGEPLKRFKVARLGQAALVVPVKAKNEVMGLLVVVRRAAQPFNATNQASLEAVADYASISLMNARLFRALEDRARALQQSAESAQNNARQREESIRSASQKIGNQLSQSFGQLDILLKDPALQTQQRTFQALNAHLQEIKAQVDALAQGS
jgi:two-component system NtrC family sensor kinase